MPDPAQSRWRSGAWPYVLILASAFILASNHVLGRWVHGHLPPMGIGFWRVAIATLVLAPFVGRSLWRKRAILLANWKLFLVLGIALGPFGNAAVYIAYHFTTAINGGVVSTAQPAVTVLLSILIFRDGISRIQALGMAIAAAGVLVIILRGDLAVLATLEPNIGDLIMIGAMAGFACYNVMLRKVPREFSVAELLVGVQLFAIIVLAPLYAIESVVYMPMPVTPESLATLAWVGIVVAILAVGMTNTAVLALGANKASMSNYIRACFTALLAILVLGEALEPFHLVAFALVVVGVVLMGRGRRPRSAPDAGRTPVAGPAPVGPVDPGDNGAPTSRK